MLQKIYGKTNRNPPPKEFQTQRHGGHRFNKKQRKITLNLNANDNDNDNDNDNVNLNDNDNPNFNINDNTNDNYRLVAPLEIKF